MKINVEFDNLSELALFCQAIGKSTQTLPVSVSVQELHDKVDASILAINSEKVAAGIAKETAMQLEAAKHHAAKTVEGEKPKVEHKPAKTEKPKPEDKKPDAGLESPFETAKDLVNACMRIKGRDATAAILAEFGAKRLGEVANEKLPDLIEKLTAAAQG